MPIGLILGGLIAYRILTGRWPFERTKEKA
jgi:hypothetical protein